MAKKIIQFKETEYECCVLGKGMYFSIEEQIGKLIWVRTHSQIRPLIVQFFALGARKVSHLDEKAPCLAN